MEDLKPWGIQIFDEKNDPVIPQPREKAVVVYSLNNCKIAFNHAPFLEYIILCCTRRR